MNSYTSILVVMRGLTFIAGMLSLVYVLGIIWRVEKRLDTSYKFFLLAVILLSFEELLNFVGIKGKEFLQIINAFSRFLGAVFFLAGILEMRKLIRKMDGEL